MSHRQSKTESETLYIPKRLSRVEPYSTIMRDTMSPQSPPTPYTPTTLPSSEPGEYVPTDTDTSDREAVPVTEVEADTESGEPSFDLSDVA